MTLTAVTRADALSAKLRSVSESRFGKLLLAESIVNIHTLSAAVDHSELHRLALADAIVALGLASEDDSYKALATATGMSLVDLSNRPAPSALALRLVPERVARKHLLLPLEEDNRTLTYAVARPFDNDADRDVGFASGRRAVAVLARRSDLLRAVDEHYPMMGPIDQLLNRMRSSASVESMGGEDISLHTDSPMVDLCNHIIARAVEAGASDVHIEPAANGVTVRYRLCGILETMFVLPPEASAPVRNRFKVMAKADISVRNRPQDGAFQLSINGRRIDVRFSTLPTISGEKLVMRVIDSQATAQTLDSMGYDEPNLARLRKALARPDGLVLVTGPTGCGKTTVLYSALNHLTAGHGNIVSVEDPVERQIQGVNQIQVNSRAGNTFTSVLRSVLRQDPNVIMVGEVRDTEVAQIVGQAAYTGHLVLSSLHTADAASAVTRLLNLGLEPFKIAESLTAIVAQRLVRKLCPDCRRVHGEDEAERLGMEHGIPSVPASAGVGCDRCKHTGYTDRIPVAEVLVPDDAIRTAISDGARAPVIRAAMRAAGCASMRERALQLVSEGITSIEEIDRVLANDDVATVHGSGRKRVLITDDDRITRMLLKLLLEKDGYDVLEGENGRHAVEIAHREHPDLLIIDLNMPEMDGYQAIAQVRRDVSLATLPVMVLTAEDGPGIELRVLDLGADDYILKPFEPAILLSRVAAAFRRMERMAA